MDLTNLSRSALAKRAAAYALILGRLAALWLVLPGTAWSGAIQGSVRYAGPGFEPKKLKVSIDRYICGQYTADESLIASPGGGIQNAVVSLVLTPDAQTAASPLPGEVNVDQKNCVFEPHVVVVPAGGTVNFLNSDRLLHNVRGRAEANRPFNRAQPKGRTVSVKFDEPETVRIDCDLHSWMRAWVVVASHSFYAVTDAAGRFVLENVPPGTYTLRVWHESLGTITKEVKVPDKGAAQVSLEMVTP